MYISTSEWMHIYLGTRVTKLLLQKAQANFSCNSLFLFQFLGIHTIQILDLPLDLALSSSLLMVEMIILLWREGRKSGKEKL